MANVASGDTPAADDPGSIGQGGAWESRNWTPPLEVQPVAGTDLRAELLGCLDPISLRPLESGQQVHLCQCSTAYHQESWELLLEFNDGRCVNCLAVQETRLLLLK